MPGRESAQASMVFLYRRAMLEDIGGFDDDFFLYCEDTDLGLDFALSRMLAGQKGAP